VLTYLSATNAILEGKGAKSALVVTAGHKDVLSVRRSQIPGGLGAWINFVPPPPNSTFSLQSFNSFRGWLTIDFPAEVPLESTVQCVERIDVNGEVVTAVDVEALSANLRELKQLHPDLDAVTISLLNSYRNDAHERQVAEVVRKEVRNLCLQHQIHSSPDLYYTRSKAPRVNRN